ncbi:hypothetical protein COOONC_08201 [Cooperia oncophora]
MVSGRHPRMNLSKRSQTSDMTGFNDTVPRYALMRFPDSLNLFPHGLEPPAKDFDANSVGFVDIEQLRELEELQCSLSPSSFFYRRTKFLIAFIPNLHTYET